MPVFISALLGGLISAAGTIAGRVMLSLGFGLVTYTGVTTLFDFATGHIWSSLASLPSGLQGVLGVLQVDTSISIITSAVLVRLTLNGLSSGVFKKWVAQ